MFRSVRSEGRVLPVVTAKLIPGSTAGHFLANPWRGGNFHPRPGWHPLLPDDDFVIG
jgi:hypothetical protein